jgi:2-dehydro-3-deoxyphosphogluconate aldolase/(4S)-4-hydroxy-2-oxoglutarate aldolase
LDKQVLRFRGKCMDIMERIELTGLIPVVVLENLDDALPVANALLEGDLPIMEITMRTKAALDCIEKIRESLPEILIGAGTVRSIDQASAAVSLGAQFIVTPGFDEPVVKWCIEKNVVITPGCVTPTEIEMANKYKLDVLKFFPANVYGGIDALKALNGPYKTKKFIPTGGIDIVNLKDFVDKDYVFAVGASFLSSSSAIALKAYEKITTTAKQAISILLGFELAHIGINASDGKAASEIVATFDKAFGLGIKEGSSSDFAGSIIEVSKCCGLGHHGHIAIRTNNIARAIYYLRKRGFDPDMTTAKEKNGKMIAVYLENEVSGFAIHLLQK